MYSCPGKQGLIILVESTISSSEESSGSESSGMIRIGTPFSTVWDFFFWNRRQHVLPGPCCLTLIRPPMSIGKSNPRRKKYLFFVLPVNESFACWQPFQLGFCAGARADPAPNTYRGSIPSETELQRDRFSLRPRNYDVPSYRPIQNVGLSRNTPQLATGSGEGQNLTNMAC